MAEGGENIPPFTPDQLSWINNLTVSRQDESSRPSGLSSAATTDTSNPLLSTAASSAGKRTLSVVGLVC